MNNFPKANSFNINLVRSKSMGPNPLKLCEELPSLTLDALGGARDRAASSPMYRIDDFIAKELCTTPRIKFNCGVTCPSFASDETLLVQ